MGLALCSYQVSISVVLQVEPDAAGQITFDDVQIAVPPAVDGSELDRAIGTCTWRPIEAGVGETIETFRAAARANKVDVDRVLAI